ncbi:MAG TPA: class I SAM-dependent methyltransferase, partial [Verrucomicrobiae bacterium]
MSFDRLAPYYHGLERLFGGSLMQRNRTRHLTAVGHCRNALILGEGTGTFLIALLKAHPHLQVTCVEQSRGMIQQIRRRLATHQLSASQVTLLTQDALAWQAGSKRYDLVVTHFFLDCFRPDQLARLV